MSARRTAAEEADRAALAELLAAEVEASPDGIYVQDAEGRTAFYNERVLRMWGVDASVPGLSTVDERLAAILDRMEDRDAFMRVVLELEKEPEREANLDVRLKNGRVFACTTLPIRAPDGRRLGRVWYYRDVTVQRATEDELALARRQLAESEKLAVVGSLVSGLAHEVRTPLTYMSNHAELLRRWLTDAGASGALPPADRARLLESAESVVEGIERINRLVGELRRFTRRAEKSRPADLDDAVRGAVLLFQSAHRGRVLVEAAYGDAGSVALDRGQVEQVVLNLLENAADASPSGGRVRVTTARTADGSTLAVEDWGIGIPPEARGQMFEPFFTTKASGLGLGLAIVRRLVETGGGSIDVASTPGKGTRFTVALPRAPLAADAAPPAR